MYYDKRIRYLSYYESDIKLQNAGYVKFQVRDSLCQMIIYVKGPRLMGSGEAAVYLLSRKEGQSDEDGFYMGRKDSRMQKHLLGNLGIHNGQGHCAVRMNAENMADCGLRYDEICGIRIELHEYQYLESQWSVVNFMPGTRRMPGRENPGYRLRTPPVGTAEKEPVKVDLIVTPVSENLKVEKLAREDAEPVYEEIERGETLMRETAVQMPGGSSEGLSEEELLSEDEESMQGMLAREVRREEKRSAGLMQPEQNAQAEPAETSTQSGQVQRAKQPEQTLEEEILQGMERAQREESPREPGGAQLRESPQESEGVQKEENLREENLREAGYVQREEKPREAESAQREKNLQEAEHMRSAEIPQGRRAAQETESARDTTEAASEEEIQLAEEELQPDKWEQLRKTFPVVHPIREEEEYLKISPKDFVIFTEKYQELVHNSFLLHGYYNYKHLILGKKEKEGRTIYYLGVPGTFHEREKTVAVMFGFEAFDGKREPAENGDFGYYLRRVEI